tara:strand:+ start:218 stop:790 length:573 start_codon:yes stop_codon:yes gene_type:complete
MQPNPWDDLTPEQDKAEVLIDGNPVDVSTGFGNQIIMLQPPSSASKIIGILLIIWGAMNGIFLLLALIGWSSEEIREEQGLTALEIVLNLFSGLIGISTSILGGIWMMNYQRKGVYLVLIGIIIGFVLSIILSLTGGATQSLAADQNVSEGVVTSITIGITAVCSAVCGLIVAIPLMISNNGLDDSKLFG